MQVLGTAAGLGVTACVGLARDT